MSTTSASEHQTPPPDMGTPADHFTTLGLPVRYDLSDTEITTAYRGKSRETHPDRFAGEDAQTIAEATRRSAAVNDAYRTLIDPVTRADYMLLACDGPGADTVRDVPGDLLAEVMMMREAIDVAKASGDHAALETHRADIARRRREAIDDIGAAARNLHRANDDDKRGMRITLNAVKYYDNLMEQVAIDPLNGGRA